MIQKTSLFNNGPQSALRYLSSRVEVTPGLAHIDPFGRFPNVSRFEVHVNAYDALLLKHGIVKRLDPKIVSDPFRNKQRNRFIDHNVRRLNKYRTSPVLYWCIAKYILQRSDTFMILSLTKIRPNWHRDLNRFKVYYTIKRVKFLRRTLSADLDFKRVFIPKKDGTLRGLGVPKLEWRIYLNLYNNLLMIYLYDFIPLQQHGFTPGRGTLTAWKQVLEKAIHAQHIFEFDLKKFFPSVRLAAVTNVLRYYKLPEWVVKNLEHINSNYAVIPAESSDYEREIIAKARLQEVPEDLYYDMIDDRGKLDLRKVYKNTLGSTTPPSDEMYLHWSEYYEGLPQGSPLSPLLSIIILYTTLLHKSHARDGSTDFVMYADDGLFYGDLNVATINKELKTPVMEFCNVLIHPEKSGYIKLYGQWLKPLKFLGMVYDPFTNELSASTRNGATLTFDKQALLVEHHQALKVSKGNQAKYQEFGLASLKAFLVSQYHALESFASLAWRLVKDLFSLPSGTRNSVMREMALRAASLTDSLWDIKRNSPQYAEAESTISPEELDESYTHKSIKNAHSWVNFLNSRLAGLIQSRLYANDWNSDVAQDFNLSSIPNSIQDKLILRADATVFNSSSFAVDSMFSYLRAQKLYVRRSERGQLFSKSVSRMDG
jgi:hypothetical protein